jgi:hypothetical protein
VAVTYTCDRCGNVLEQREVRLTVRDYGCSDTVLCNRCYLDFHYWVKAGL